MHDSLFQFAGQPFSAAPDPAAYVPLEPMEMAGKTLTEAIRRRRGPSLLIGPTGSGKSLLAQLVAGQVKSSHHPLLLSSSVFCTRKALLQHILHGMQVPFHHPGEGELRLAIVDALAKRENLQGGLALIVDEADRLATPLLEELRVITNIVRDGQPQVQLLLVGDARLEEQLAEPRMSCLNQRIASRCYLRAWKRDETTRYIQRQLERAGADAAQLFTPEALITLHEITTGTPRLVNQLADHALWLAAKDQAAPIDERAIHVAWSDLQQLPLPAEFQLAALDEAVDTIEFGELDEIDTAAPAVASQTAAVEFGTLDDELEEFGARIEIEAEPTQAEPTQAEPTHEQPIPVDDSEVSTLPIRWRPVIFQPPAATRPTETTDSPVSESDCSSSHTPAPHLYKPLLDQLRQQRS